MVVDFLNEYIGLPYSVGHCARIVDKHWNIVLSLWTCVLMVIIMRFSPNHTLLKYISLIKKNNQITHVYFKYFLLCVSNPRDRLAYTKSSIMWAHVARCASICYMYPIHTHTHTHELMVRAHLQPQQQFVFSLLWHTTCKVCGPQYDYT